MAKKQPKKQVKDEVMKFKVATIGVENSDGVKFLEVRAIVPQDISKEANAEIEKLLTSTRDGYESIFNRHFKR